MFAAADAAAVDTILHNGRIWTGDPAQPAAAAIAIDDGRIVAIGADVAILRLATDDSQRIDLKGRRVVPGINDAHTHITLGLPSVDIELPRDAGSAQVREAIAALPTTGDGWITADIGMDVLRDPAMRRGLLDALQPQRPVLLTGWTGHGMLVNSAAQRAPDWRWTTCPPAAGWAGTRPAPSMAACTNTRSGRRAPACLRARRPCAA
ncbi:amidohydrolase family protein [Pseudoxanthomonas sp. NC8]|nr:amidohydrolase family protein [Pseudoxanthomonas sp. NC8]